MDSLDKFRIRLLQFLMARGDLMRADYEKSLYSFVRNKNRSENDVLDLLKLKHDLDFYDSLFKDIFELF